jgi:hypothetical protein
MSIKINIGEILTKAWQITWKFKVLWIFGIFAGCTANNRSSFNFNGGSGGGGNGGTGPSNGQLPEFFRRFENMRPEQAIQSFLNEYTGIIVAIILVLCVLWFLFYFLGIMGRIGLIKGVGKADSGAERMTFGEIWTESMPYFWRMFGLSLLIGLPVFLLVVIMLVGLGFAGYSAFTSDGSNGSVWALIAGIFGIFIVSMCILSLIMMIVGLIVEQAQNAIVLEDMGVLAGLGRGWGVFSKNWLSVIVVGLILWVISIVVGIVIALPLIVVIIPAAIGMGFAAASQNWVLLAILVGGCILLYLPIGLLLGGIQQTYFQSVWTLAYRRLTELMAPPAPAIAMVENLGPQ